MCMSFIVIEPSLHYGNPDEGVLLIFKIWEKRCLCDYRLKFHIAE